METVTERLSRRVERRGALLMAEASPSPRKNASGWPVSIYPEERGFA